MSLLLRKRGARVGQVTWVQFDVASSGSVTSATIAGTDGADVTAINAAIWTTGQIAALDGADVHAIATTVTTGAQIAVVDGADLTDIQTSGTDTATTTGGVDLSLLRRPFPQPSRTREWLDTAPRKVRRALERVAQAAPADVSAAIALELDEAEAAQLERYAAAVEAMIARGLAKFADLARIEQEEMAAMESERLRLMLRQRDDDDAAIILLLH